MAPFEYDVFEGTRDGYSIVMPSVALQGVVEFGQTSPGRWVACQATGDPDVTYHGVGDGPQTAMLDLIVKRGRKGLGADCSAYDASGLVGLCLCQLFYRVVG